MKLPFKKRFKSRKEKIGLPPGTIRAIGNTVDQPSIKVFTYNNESYSKSEIIDSNTIAQVPDGATRWIKISGINVQTIEWLGNVFDFHNLLLEDIVNVDQRPKIDDFGTYIFMVLKQHIYENEQLQSRQISFILTKNIVISIEETESTLFDPICDRIIAKRGYIRSFGSDYLLYALADVTVDYYFDLIEKIDEKYEALKLLAQRVPDNNLLLTRIRILKEDTYYLRKYILPTREAIFQLERLDTTLIHDNTDTFLRDLIDHINVIFENLEFYKEQINGVREDYISNISLKMNNIIQLLTIISSIFIPLTFITGLYGMNFKHIPGLENYNGFFIIVGFMFIIAVVLLLYYKIKKWV